MRFATGVDDDLRPFHERFRDDPVIGRRCAPTRGCASAASPTPWEALRGAITEQLIEFERAVAIQRRLIARARPPLPATGLRDCPTPARDRRAGARPSSRRSTSPPKRALALRRAAREVAAGRVDLADRERAWPRLRAIPEHRAAGRSRCSRCTGSGATTSSRPATSATSSSSGGCTTGQPAGARRRGRGARVLRALRGVEGAGRRVPVPRRRRGLLRSRARPGVEPLARQELVGQRPRRASGGRLSSLFALHPALVGVPLGAGPASRTACPCPSGKNTGSVALTTPVLEAAVEALGRPSAARRRRLPGRSRSSGGPRAVACRKRRSREAPACVEVLAAGDEDQLVVGRHAELLHPQDHRACGRARCEVDALVVPERAERRVDLAWRASPARG